MLLIYSCGESPCAEGHCQSDMFFLRIASRLWTGGDLPGGTRHHSQYKNDDSRKAHSVGLFFGRKKARLEMVKSAGALR